MAHEVTSARRGAATADVAIIGGGVIGCSIALRLAQAGLGVTVVERGEPGGEASSAAAGMIAPQGEMTEPDDFYRLTLSSRDLYPGFVAEVEELSGQELGYRREGTLLVAMDPGEAAALDGIYTRNSQAGPAGEAGPLERVAPVAIPRLAPGLSPTILGGLFVPGDQWVDNERLTPALVEAGRRLGVRFLTPAEVTRLKLGPGGHRLQELEVRSATGEAGFGLPSSSGEVTHLAADHFILAAGCWSGRLASSVGLALPVEPCRGQMIEFETPVELPRVVRAGHTYLVPRGGCRVLVGSTSEYAGFEKEVTGAGLRGILERGLSVAPFLGGLRFRRAWAGLRPDTADHLPILGYGDIEKLVFATGHFRNGILLAPITAQLISELVLTGSTSRPIDAYRPARFAARARA